MSRSGLPVTEEYDKCAELVSAAESRDDDAQLRLDRRVVR